jgi:AAA domain
MKSVAKETLQDLTPEEIEEMQDEFYEEQAAFSTLSAPFEDDWDDLSEEEKQRYYDACAKEAYASWCEENPLPKVKRPFIIETHLPANQVHIVCGESGAQKTSILLTLLNDWRKGKDVLGRKSAPVPMMFLAYDRGDGTAETFETLNLDYRLFGYYKMTKEDFDIPLETLLRRLKQENPSVGLFVVDSMFIASPDEIRYKTKKGEQTIKDPYKVTARWLRELDFLCTELGITIIGLHHAAKNGQEHSGKRTRALGTVAIGATTGTTIIADLVDSPSAALPRTQWTIRPRNAPEEVFYFDRQTDGSIALGDPEAENAEAFENFMQEADGSYTRAQIEEVTGMPRSTCLFYISKALKDGRLKRDGSNRSTRYVRMREKQTA